jgi:hypothetical protein
MDWEILDTLCISGGGVNGISYIGALNYLITNNYIKMDNIKLLIGSSIGGLICTFLVLGYTMNEIIEFILNFDFGILEQNIDSDNIFINYGLCNNDNIKLVIEHFIKLKYDNVNITFIELYKLTNKKLIITGTNITDKKLEYFDYINTPHMQIIDALRITICVPLIFTPIKYNNKLYIDGAIASNVPINLCNKKTTLGIIGEYNINIESIISVFFSCITIALKSHIIIEDYNLLEIKCISNSFELKLDKILKTLMINSGIDSAKTFINNNNNNNNNNNKDTQTEFIDDIIKLELNIKI